MGSVGLVGNLTAFILEASARQAVDIRFLGCELQQVVDVVIKCDVSSRWLTPPEAFGRHLKRVCVGLLFWRFRLFVQGLRDVSVECTQ